MENFNYSNPTRIVFGKDTELKVGKLCAEYAKKVLLHYGGGSIKANGLYDKVIASLNEAGVEYFELGGVQPNPVHTLVYEGIAICKKHDIGLVLGVGGGSVLDSAKAIAIGAKHDGDFWDFFTRKGTPKQALPIGCIMTLPGTGSESSDSIVIQNNETNMKMGCSTRLGYPTFSILNPELSFTLPPYQTAAGTSDAICHVLERFFTNSVNTYLSDRLCLSVVKTLVSFTPVVLRNPNDYDARAEIMYACKIAHDNSLSCGRIGDWASHRIEHELSLNYGIAHGAGLAIIFPNWMKYTCGHNPERFAMFANEIFGVEESADKLAMAMEGIQRFQDYLRSIDMPITLRDAGITDNRYAEMAENELKNFEGVLGNFVKLRHDDLVKIYEMSK